MAENKTPPSGESLLDDVFTDDTDYSSILSGIKKTTQGYDATAGIEGVSKDRDKIRQETAKSFDPLIGGPWKDNSPEAQKQREETKAAGKAYRGKFAEMLAKRRAAKKTALEESKEKKKEVKEKAYGSASERMEAAAEEANEAERVRLQDKVKEYQQKAAQAYDKGNNFAFQWYVNQIPKLKEQLVTEKYKKIPTKADVLDLNKDERKAIMDAQKDVLKSQFKAIKDLKNSDEYKGDKRELNALKEEYQKGIAETTKRDAPYAIRNAFLIIDAIQKSLQNIGRAMPQTKYSPAYTKTPMEEPNLFKLWREQIEKGQERTQKAEDAGTDVFSNVLSAQYGVPKGAPEKMFERALTWEDKLRDAKLDGIKPEVMLAYRRQLEQDFGDSMTQTDLERAAKIAAYEAAGKGDLVEAEKKLWMADAYPSMKETARKLMYGSAANHILYNTLKEIGKSGFLKFVTGGVANDVINTIAAGLGSLPDFADDEKYPPDKKLDMIFDWMYTLGKTPKDAEAFWNNVQKIDTKALSSLQKEMEKQQNKMSKLLEEKTSAETQKIRNDSRIDEIEVEINGLPENSYKYKNGKKEIERIQNNTGVGGGADNDACEKKIKAIEKKLASEQKIMDAYANKLKDMLVPPESSTEENKT